MSSDENTDEPSEEPAPDDEGPADKATVLADRPNRDIKEEPPEETARRYRCRADKYAERARRAHDLSIQFLEMAQDLQEKMQDLGSEGESEQRLRRRIDQLKEDSRFYRQEAEYLQSEADEYHEKARELARSANTDA